jgi:penicillin-binding protein 1A
MTWHEIMAYAHQGIELKPLPGDPPQTAKTVPRTPAKTVAELGAPQRPTSLSAASIEVLGTIADWAKAAEKRQAETHGGGYKALP